MKANSQKKTKRIDIIRRLTTDAMLSALFAALNYVITIEITPQFKLSIASFAIIIAALLYGAADACTVAFMGELIYQLLRFGFMPETVLYIIPPVVRALILGAFATYLFKKGKYMEKTPLVMYLSAVIAAIATSAVTTGSLYITAKMYGRFEIVTFTAGILSRFTSGIFTAIVLASAAMPIAAALRRAKIGRRVRKTATNIQINTQNADAEEQK